MARRIRSIKPEILDDEKAAGLSSDAWRLWVSSWLLADDMGSTRGDSRRLAADAFWACPHPVDVGACLAELETAGLVRRYMVRGETYMRINGWAKHQRIDNASKMARLPSIDDADAVPLAATRGEPPRTAAGLEGKGGEGKGGEGSADEPPSLPPGIDLGEAENRKQKQIVEKHYQEALEVLTELNAARSRVRPGLRGIRPTYSSLGGIAARLAAGRTLEECLLVVAGGEAECIRKVESFDWFDAISPWRPANFERRLASDSGGSAALPSKNGDMRDVQLKIAARYGE